ncbi:site-specific integrase [Pseudomonas bubulae]|uniref:site-specific integrase n=1 Tax=Pseudomonas bubulae TaxID=2316085 RepID=UPI002B1D0EC9|nr:site-specific integrase [Pseudomonas bubulae]
MSVVCEVIQASTDEALLRDVLNGDSYRTVGLRYGLSRSVVERRIKRLAERLLRTVGIPGLSLGSVAFVRRLRLNREAVELALSQVPSAVFSPEAPPLSRAALLQASERLRIDSPHVSHDLALFHVLFTTGLRPLELARLTVRDGVSDTGIIRSLSQVRAEVSHNGKARPLYFTSPRLISALQNYLDERRRRGHGVSDAQAYGGLCPDSPLFLDPYGQAYALEIKEANVRDYHRCRGMQQALRQLFRYAGLPAYSSRSARRTVIGLLYTGGADEAQAGLLLGIRDNSAVRALLPRPRPRLDDVTQKLL